MASNQDEDRRRAEKARQVGLFRYALIQDLLDPALTTRERGRLTRELAAKEHTDPFGRQVRLSRGTIDRWARHYRIGGFAALVPEPRKAVPRTPPEVLDLAAALKRENPARTAAQIQRILRTTQGWSPTDRTLQRHFVNAGLTGTSGDDRSVFGRFEATRGNELWTGDALHGPKIGGRKTYLFAFIDDHSRASVGHRSGFAEDTVRLAGALRPALAACGVPESIYVDNGSAFVDTWLLRACASLAIRLTHSRHQALEKLLTHLVGTRAARVPEHLPNRHLAVVAAVRRIGQPDQSDPAAMIERTWLGGRPEPWMLDAANAYGVTHTVFHLTNWAADPDGLPEHLQEYLHRWLPAWVVCAGVLDLDGDEVVGQAGGLDGEVAGDDADFDGHRAAGPGGDRVVARHGFWGGHQLSGQVSSISPSAAFSASVTLS
ncbi:DDE-type integrase/transposase/recombinase [Streptomyces sp. NPDC052000]|uniref:DUF6895 family protein n=1 Tax=Streptomyces sp. NPDC052000 TaxID=3155676 RepID=UPI00344D38B1